MNEWVICVNAGMGQSLRVIRIFNELASKKQTMCEKMGMIFFSLVNDDDGDVDHCQRVKVRAAYVWFWIRKIEENSTTMEKRSSKSLSRSKRFFDIHFDIHFDYLFGFCRTRTIFSQMPGEWKGAIDIEIQEKMENPRTNDWFFLSLFW